MNVNNEIDLIPKPTGFAISPFKVVILAIGCLLGVTVLYSLWHLEQTRYSLGQPVELPRAAYARTSCGDYYETLMFTVGPNGEISNRSGMMSMEALIALLIEKTKDKPREKGWFMDAEGELAQYEYMREINVRIRVDANCPADQLAPIMRALERRGIRYASFSVNVE